MARPSLEAPEPAPKVGGRRRRSCGRSTSAEMSATIAAMGQNAAPSSGGDLLAPLEAARKPGRLRRRSVTVCGKRAFFATELAMSKSGLFAHISSKASLQLATIEKPAMDMCKK